MSEFKKFSKVVEIMGELYEEDPEYFADCFFNMYYQMKKKLAVDKKCNGNPDEIKKMWQALNLFKYLVKEENEDPNKAFTIAYRKFGVDKEDMSSILGSFKAFRGAKKTRFKIFL